MNHTCLAIGLALALLAAPAHAHRRQREREARAYTEDFARVWGSNNPQALSAFYADHADYINPRGRRALGRMEIEKLFQDEHSTFFKGSRMLLEIERLRFLEDDLVLVDATAIVEGVKAPEGTVLPPQRFHLFNVLRHDDGRWITEASRVTVFQIPR